MGPSVQGLVFLCCYRLGGYLRYQYQVRRPAALVHEDGGFF